MEQKKNNEQKADAKFVSQPIAKPLVVGSQSQVHPIKNAFTNKDDFWIEYTSKNHPSEKR